MMQESNLKSLAFLEVLWKAVKSAVPRAGAEDQLPFHPEEILCERGTPEIPWQQSSARAEWGSKLSLAWSRTTWTEDVKITMNIFILIIFYNLANHFCFSFRTKSTQHVESVQETSLPISKHQKKHPIKMKKTSTQGLTLAFSQLL